LTVALKLKREGKKYAFIESNLKSKVSCQNGELAVKNLVDCMRTKMILLARSKYLAQE
jgi:hypothetical protein